MSNKKSKSRLEPGSWGEIKTKFNNLFDKAIFIKTNLKDTQLLKIVGYRGEMLHCIDDDGRMTMLRPNSTKVSRIFEVKPDGKVIEGKS